MTLCARHNSKLSSADLAIQLSWSHNCKKNVIFVFVCLIHYLPLWPVILGKDGIICVHCPICHQHNGLATLTTPPSLVELETETERGGVTSGEQKQTKILFHPNRNLTSLKSTFFNHLPNVSSSFFPFEVVMCLYATYLHIMEANCVVAAS